ncbi:hypothetical protein QJQ45_022243 [Haematococcus lacustris]|nr:hypothetical protein QJQ45_022243 [Haematococcus lacustris]
MMTYYSTLLSALLLAGARFASGSAKIDWQWKSGRASWYGNGDWPIHIGGCGYDYLWKDEGTGWDVAALADVSPDYYNSCGLCYEIACDPTWTSDYYGEKFDRSRVCYDSSASVVVRIVDTCQCTYPANWWSNKRWCCGDKAHFDVSMWAFEKLAELRWGVIALKYRAVPCGYKPSKPAAELRYPSPGIPVNPPANAVRQARDWPDFRSTSIQPRPIFGSVETGGALQNGFYDISWKASLQSLSATRTSGMLGGPGMCARVANGGALALKAWNGVFSNAVALEFWTYVGVVGWEGTNATIPDITVSIGGDQYRLFGTMGDSVGHGAAMFASAAELRFEVGHYVPQLLSHNASSHQNSTALKPATSARTTHARTLRRPNTRCFASLHLTATTELPQTGARASVPLFMLASASELPSNTTAPAWRVAVGNLAAGAVSGCAVEAALYPLDTIKTRLQAMIGGGGLKALLDAGGGRALYAGTRWVWGNLVGVAPASAIFISVYEPVKAAVEAAVHKDQMFLGAVLAGMAAGTASSLVRVPTEVIKQRLQTKEFAGAATAVRSIVAREGLRGLYAGYGAFLLRDLPFDAIEFVAYEQVSVNGQLKQGLSTYLKRELKPQETSMIGAVAGGFTGLVTTPLDVLKTRLMTQGANGRYKSLVDAVVQIARDEGTAAFLKGWQPRLIWISLGGFVFFPVLEASKKAFSPQPLTVAFHPRATPTKNCFKFGVPSFLASAMLSFMYTWYAVSMAVAFNPSLTAPFSSLSLLDSSLYGFCSSGVAAFHWPMIMAMRSRPVMIGDAATQRCSNAAKGMQEVQLEGITRMYSLEPVRRGGVEELGGLEGQSEAVKETKLGAECNLTRTHTYTNQQLPREEAQPRWGKRTQAARTSASVPLPIPLRSNSHDDSPLPSSLTNTQQQPADISDERQPFTSSTLTMTGWSRLQPETAYPTFPSHTQEPAKGPRGAAKTQH